MAVRALRPTIRPPSLGDARTLEEAERECFPDPWPGHLFLAEVRAPGRFHRLALAPDGQLMAYLLGVWQYLDLHILKVATRPPWRRQGLARHLLVLAGEHVIEAGGESITLEVRASNEPAIRLYQTLGYRLKGRRPHYYGDGEDALIMTWEVPRLL